MPAVLGTSKNIWNFDPRMIPGCALWLDGADSAQMVFSSGSLVQQWSDKSSNAWHVTQSTTTKQPTFTTNALNGLSGLQFINPSGQTTGQCLLTASQSSLDSITGLTLFTVLKPTWTSGDNVANPAFFGIRAASGGVSKINYYYNNDYSGLGVFNGTSVSYHTGSSIAPYTVKNTPALVCMTNNNGSNIANVNGTITGSSNAVTFGTGTGLPICIGGDNYGNGEVWPGYIYEVILYTSVLTTAQRQQVEGYLSWKWGLQTTIPAFVNPKSIPGCQCQLWLDGTDPAGP